MDTRIRRITGLLLAASFASTSVFAAPPWARVGDEEHGRHDRHEERHERRHEERHVDKVVVVRQGAYFSDRHRESVQHYYVSHCPPGHAKKHECMPRDHVKRVWVVGQPLPPTVVLAPPPPQLVVGLPAPPVGHRYVEVAGDVLLIAVGSKMVVDGISGLSR